jgi:anti-anti-sigma factor
MSSYRMERSDGGCRVSIDGGLTAVVVPELQQVLKQEVEGGTQRVTVDLAATYIVDSSGIGLLIAASNTLSHKRGQLAVVNVSPEIFRLFQSMRLVPRLNVSGRATTGPAHE